MNEWICNTCLRIELGDSVAPWDWCVLWIWEFLVLYLGEAPLARIYIYMYYIFKVNRETVIPEFIDQILVSLGFSYNISSQASFFEGRGV